MTDVTYGYSQERHASTEYRRRRVPFAPARGVVHHINWFDKALICLFMIGLYIHFTIQISATLPFPSAPAGVAGVILLWRRRNQITSSAFAGFILVMAVFAASVLSATDIKFLPRRVNGLIQLTYSIIIGYALFLTVIQASRHQIAGLFLVMALVILVGCLLEQYAGLRPLSDAVRKVLYSKDIYDADLRDVLLYNRVRPKFFASEPSNVNLCYTLFAFVWMVVSPWRWKLVVYVALVGVGLWVMPGPTLILMLLLILPYMLFLASRKAGRLDLGRLLMVACVAAVFAVPFVVLSQGMFSARLAEISAGNDPSFFFRVQGPFLAALHVFAHYPLAGVGLTGESIIELEITNVYMRSASYSSAWRMEAPANYFWLHWIYLGLGWGLVTITAVMVWLRALGLPSVAFCLMVWVILGQSLGAYVGPFCWSILFLTSAAAILHQRANLPYERGGRARGEARHSIRRLRPSMPLSADRRPAS